MVVLPGVAAWLAAVAPGALSVWALVVEGPPGLAGRALSAPGRVLSEGRGQIRAGGRLGPPVGAACCGRRVDCRENRGVAPFPGSAWVVPSAALPVSVAVRLVPAWALSVGGALVLLWASHAAVSRLDQSLLVRLAQTVEIRGGLNGCRVGIWVSWIVATAVLPVAQSVQSAKWAAHRDAAGRSLDAPGLVAQLVLRQAAFRDAAKVTLFVPDQPAASLQLGALRVDSP